MESRPLPSNLEAEKAVLGGCLVASMALERAVESLKPDHFYRAAHQTIFSLMAEMHARGENVDPITLKSALGDRLEDVGGPSYIFGLTDNPTPTSGIPHHARLIIEAANYRRLIVAANKVLADAYIAEKPPAHILADNEADLLGLMEDARAGYQPLIDLVPEVMDRMEDAEAKHGMTGVETGFTRLDDMLCGLQPADLILVAARPSIGKTAFALNIAQHVGTKGVVAIASLEMSAQALYTRLLTSEARVDAQRFRKGLLRDVEKRRIGEAISSLAESQIYIDDAGGQTPIDLRARAKKLQRDKGLALLIVDYIQLMTMKQSYTSRQQEVTAISAALKAIAKELRVPVVALSQLSRQPEARKDKRPQLSDLRESGALEQDADVVLLLHRPEHYERTDENDGIAEVIIGKQRNGPIGTVKLAFIPEHTRFGNLAEQASML